MPRDFDENAVEGNRGELVVRAVTAAVAYLLVPLLLIYTAILYAYGAKIAIDGVLPKGQIAMMVLGYGGIGFAAMYLLYPARNVGVNVHIGASGR